MEEKPGIILYIDGMASDICITYYSDIKTVIIIGDSMSAKNKSAVWKNFLNLCSQMEQAEQLDKFFKLFLTLEEKEDLIDRYLIIKELLSGQQTQRKIASECKVSIGKITRGSNELKRTDNDFKEFIKKKMN